MGWSRSTKQLKTNAGDGGEKEEHSSLLVGMKTGVATLDISVGNSYKLENKIKSLTEHRCLASHDHYCLFTIARKWEEPKCSSTDKWTIKMWYVYIMEYNSGKIKIITFQVNG